MAQKRNLITIGLLVLFTAMIVAGIALDEPQVVLDKAINICMECIGIG